MAAWALLPLFLLATICTLDGSPMELATQRNKYMRYKTAVAIQKEVTDHYLLKHALALKENVPSDTCCFNSQFGKYK